MYHSILIFIFNFQPMFKDKLSALEVQMRYEVDRDEDQSARQSYYQPAMHSQIITPVIDPRLNHRSLSDAASILKDCGFDNICVPELAISYNLSSSQYLIGSKDSVEMTINVTNHGEDAYEAIMYIRFPPNAGYGRTEQIEAYPEGVGSVLCSAPNNMNNHTLRCELGNPLIKNSHMVLRTTFRPSVLVEGSAAPIPIEIWLNSSNLEDDTTVGNNQVTFTIPVIVETDLFLQGLSDPQPLQHNVSNFELMKMNTDESGETWRDLSGLSESDVGPEVTHVYHIGNIGPTDVIEAQVYILWPSFRPNGDPLLYLTYQPLVEGKGRCDFVADVNPYQVLVRLSLLNFYYRSKTKRIFKSYNA